MAKTPARAFAAVLEQLREARGLSPADLARALNVDPTVVSRWRRGLVTPGIDRIAQIAEYFEVDRETMERLAGYRANTVTGMQDTIDPAIAAVLDAEVQGLRRKLHGIPEVFWPAILRAMSETAESVWLAIEVAMRTSAVSQTEHLPVAGTDDAASENNRQSGTGSNPPLSAAYALAGSI